MCGLGVCAAGGGRPREPVFPALAVRAGHRKDHSASGRFLGRISLRGPGCQAGPRGPPSAPRGAERAPARRCPRREPPRPGSPSAPLAQRCSGAPPAGTVPRVGRAAVGIDGVFNFNFGRYFSSLQRESYFSPAGAAPAGHPLTYRVLFGFTQTPSSPGRESLGSACAGQIGKEL